MSLRGFLLSTPAVLLGVALQSAFWIPRAADPERAKTVYVLAERADARRLDPLLVSDYVSARIVDQMFEGLVRVGEHGRLIPALAESWEEREYAYLAVLPERQLAGGEPGTRENVLARLESELANGALSAIQGDVAGFKVERTASRVIAHELELRAPDGTLKTEPVRLEVQAGERVRFDLRRISSEFELALTKALGSSYVSGPLPKERLRLLLEKWTTPKAELEQALFSTATLSAIVPVLEHHPVTRFHLRRNVRFHDGSPLTAKDVRFSYEAALDPANASPLAAYFEPVEKAEAIDDFTFEVTYKRLFSPALYAWDTIGIVPEHRLNQAALALEPGSRAVKAGERRSLRDSSFQKQPIGTGPFRFAAWQPSETIELQRFEDYWGKKPEFEKLILRTIPDEVAQELELHSGSLDRFVAKTHQAARLRADPRYQSVFRDEGQYSYIGYNFRRPLFRDRRVRRALGMAINVNELVRYVLQGEAQRTTGPYYVNTPYYDRSVVPLPYDPEGAKGLLAEAGFAPNAQGVLERAGQELKFEVVTSAGNSEREAIATIAEDAWRKIGVRAELRFLDWSVLMEQRVYRGDFDVLVFGWVGGDVSADKFGIWHSSQTDSHEMNFTGYQSPAADRLLEQIRREYDPDRQVRLAHALHQLLADEQPYTFLHARRETWVFNGRMRELRHDDAGRALLTPLQSAPSGEPDYFLPFWTKTARALPDP